MKNFTTQLALITLLSSCSLSIISDDKKPTLTPTYYPEQRFLGILKNTAGGLQPNHQNPKTAQPKASLLEFLFGSRNK